MELNADEKEDVKHGIDPTRSQLNRFYKEFLELKKTVEVLVSERDFNSASCVRVKRRMQELNRTRG